MYVSSNSWIALSPRDGTCGNTPPTHPRASSEGTDPKLCLLGQGREEAHVRHPDYSQVLLPVTFPGELRLSRKAEKRECCTGREMLHRWGVGVTLRLRVSFWGKAEGRGRA